MAEQILTAKIIKKAGNGKGFMLEGQEGWFNATDKTEANLAKIGIGKEVEVSYFQKGVKKEVTMIKEVSNEAKTETPKETKSDKPTCKVCGKELKGKSADYPTCWDCKDKAPKKEKNECITEEPRKERTYTGSNYGSAEDVAGKEVGCAANCASQILSGRQEDPDTLLEMFRILFNGVLEHIRENK